VKIGLVRGGRKPIKKTDREKNSFCYSLSSLTKSFRVHSDSLQFWAALGSIYIIIYLKPQNDVLYAVFFCGISSLGILDFVLWCFTQKKLFKSRTIGHSKSDIYVEMPEMLSQDISEALRLEFMTFTSRGIVKSVRNMKVQNRAQLGMDSDTVAELFVDNSSYNVYSLQAGQLGEVDFYDYHHHVFQILRNEAYGIKDYDYLASFATDDVDSVKAHFTEGKSGSFFFFTQDKRYIIKTLDKVGVRFRMSENRMCLCQCLIQSYHILLFCVVEVIALVAKCIVCVVWLRFEFYEVVLGDVHIFCV